MSAAPRRLIQIDFLRGVAVLMVMACHLDQLPLPDGLFSPVRAAFARFGGSGVDLFFGLSGFLVGGLLFQELRNDGRMKVGRFIIRRGFKIWPSYYALLAFYWVYLIAVYRMGALESLRLLTPNFVHLQNYLERSSASHPYWNFNIRHCWSLAVEEHFYLALPFLLLAFSRLKVLSRGIPALCLLLLAGCLAMRVGTLEAEGAAARLPLLATHLRIDNLFFGVGIAYAYHFHRDAFERVAGRPAPLLAAGLILFGGGQLSRDVVLEGGVGSLLLAAGSGLLVMGLLAAPRSPLLARFFETAPARAVAFVGFYSYSVYLWHLSLGVLVAKSFLTRGILAQHPDLRWLTAAVLFVGLGIATGVALGKLIEYPALALRDRLFPSRTVVVPSERAPAQPLQGTGALAE